MLKHSSFPYSKRVMLIGLQNKKGNRFYRRWPKTFLRRMPKTRPCCHKPERSGLELSRTGQAVQKQISGSLCLGFLLLLLVKQRFSSGWPKTLAKLQAVNLEKLAQILMTVPAGTWIMKPGRIQQIRKAAGLLLLVQVMTAQATLMNIMNPLILSLNLIT